MPHGVACRAVNCFDVQMVRRGGIVVPGDQAVVEQDDTLQVRSARDGVVDLLGEQKAGAAVGDESHVVTKHLGQDLSGAAIVGQNQDSVGMAVHDATCRHE